jgi:hypothetical protein
LGLVVALVTVELVDADALAALILAS